MPQLSQLSRRFFGQGLGASLALTLMPHRGQAEEQVVEVDIREFVFDPAEVVIKRGMAVRWRNRDIAPHTATADDGAWTTDGLEQDQAGMIRFEEVGIFPYFCAFHPHMQGVVRVE